MFDRNKDGFIDLTELRKVRESMDLLYSNTTILNMRFIAWGNLMQFTTAFLSQKVTMLILNVNSSSFEMKCKNISKFGKNIHCLNDNTSIEN